MSLNEKLLKVQQELKAPKGQYNTFGKYRYRSAEDILEAVKPLNAKHGLLLVLYDEPVLIGDWHYIQATADLTDGENHIRVTAYARESLSKKGMDDSQITGTASSYARKYALNGLYLIDDTKDADTDEYRNQSARNDDFKPITQKQVGEIKINVKKLAQLRNVDEKEVYKALKISDITKISTDFAKKTLKTTEKWLEQASEKNDF